MDKQIIKDLKQNFPVLITMLYQYDLLGDLLLITSQYEKEQIDMIIPVINELDTIDDIIISHLYNYELSSLNKVDKAIIRLSTYLFTKGEIKSEIIFNIALDTTKEYSDLDDEKQHKFTNALLDKISKAVSV